jgi:hypothetical protein
MGPVIDRVESRIRLGFSSPNHFRQLFVKRWLRWMPAALWIVD